MTVQEATEAANFNTYQFRNSFGVHESQNSGLALLGEARFGTGNPDDLLGAGGFTARGLAVMSGRINAFSPHLNLGYRYHNSGGPRTWNDAVLVTGGFDDLLSEHITLAADVVGDSDNSQA